MIPVRLISSPNTTGSGSGFLFELGIGNGNGSAPLFYLIIKSNGVVTVGARVQVAPWLLSALPLTFY